MRMEDERESIVQGQKNDNGLGTSLKSRSFHRGGLAISDTIFVIALKIKTLSILSKMF